MEVFKNKKIYQLFWLNLVLGAVFITVFFVFTPLSLAEETNTNENTEETEEEPVNETDPSDDYELQRLNKLIDDKNKEIDELQKKISIYNKNIRVKQQEQLTLESQMAVLDEEIQKTALDIQSTEKEIEVLGLEIENLETRISDKLSEITDKKGNLGKLIRELYFYEQKTYLEITLTNETFSEFFSQIKYIEEVQADSQEMLDQLQNLKQQLEDKREEVLNKKEEVESKKQELENKKSGFEGQKNYKVDLLTQTEEDEGKFQDLTSQLRQEQESANSEIVTLEKQARERLEELEDPDNPDEKEDDESDLGGSNLFSWPTSGRTITAYFHDPTYPFRRYFEHPGIDIRAGQGTPVHATASGYVAIAKNAGMGYSYVMIVHENGFSTVYGHLSQINVAPETYVSRGEMIGLSGGMPGTPGAGRLTTGPHLHFEIRYQGIPVNPLNYLP